MAAPEDKQLAWIPLQSQAGDFEAFVEWCRDEILRGFGVPRLRLDRSAEVSDAAAHEDPGVDNPLTPGRLAGAPRFPKSNLTPSRST